MSENNDNRNLLVIKASAGSGKTYRLAKEYIKHLLFTTNRQDGKLCPRRMKGNNQPLNTHRQLLAITFTNKATDEMKTRIVDELYNLAQPGHKSDYLADFLADSGLPEDEVRTLAQQALNELLFDYSNFNVSTIDSFFQTILRNFARELDRDFNYDIQLEEDYAVRVAVHNFLLALGREGMPTQVDEWVKDYQKHLIHGNAEKKNWKFFDDGGNLNRFAQQINSELFRSCLDEIRTYLGHIDDKGRFQSDFEKIREFTAFIHEQVDQLKGKMDEGLRDLQAALSPIADGLSGNKSLKKWLNKPHKDGLEPLTDTMAQTDDQKIRDQFLKSFVPSDALVNQLVGLVQGHFALRNAMGFFKHVEDNLGLLGMLAMIDWFLQQYRHESNSILIGDTNELIGTVLESGSDFIYERVGTMISHFMIDEFQDTSAKQYENFRSLLLESLSKCNFNMLIGDAKQSIYRFRNADPSVFRERVGDEFGDFIYDDRQVTDESDDGEAPPTSINYRSSRRIIEFNNSLFAYLRSRFSDRSIVATTYGDVKQGLPPGIDTGKVEGYVRLLTGNYRQLLQDDVIRDAAPADVVGNEDGEVSVLDVLPGYLLRLHERYNWGSIGILVNRNKEGDQIVERILEYNKRTSGKKIRIISGESLLLNNSPIIRRIIAMLRFIDISQFGPADEDAADADDKTADSYDDMMNRIKRKRLSDRRLYTALNAFIKDVAAQPDASPAEHGLMLARSLDNAGADDGDADNTLEKLLPPAGELTTLVSIIETIILHFKRDGADAAGVDNEAAFLLAFQDTVMQFASMRNGGSVREFLKFWDEKKGTLAVSSSSHDNAIEIMSIHKAKGLEFDCVVIPFADWELDSNSKEVSYWMPKKDFISAMQSLADLGVTVCEQELVPPLLHVDKKTAVALCKDGLLAGEAADFVNKQVDDVLIDNLNKTYVAMTRPRSELHVFAKGRDNTVSPMLAGFARDGGIMSPVPDAEGWYEMGTPPTKADFKALRKKKVQKESDDDQNQASDGNVEIQGYTVNALPLKLKVRVENASSFQAEAGVRLHDLLSRIGDRNDVERIIAQGIKHGVITQDPDDPCSQANIDSHVRGPIVDDGCRVAAWFDPVNVVYSERTITSASDSLWNDAGIENLRPDRIVRRPDGSVLVIDYKTGKRDDKRYLRQLNRYIAKLRHIFPGASIAGRIWYILNDTIVDEQGKVLGFRL